MNKINFYRFLKLFCLALPLLFSASTAQAQSSGGAFVLTQSVIASGGGISSEAGNIYSITGSIGQSVTDTSNTAPFTIKSGFFTAPLLFAPTAAMVTVSGRVTTATGRGIRSVLIFMTDGQGTLRTTTSSSFGYFRFTDVGAGETYIFTAKAKRFTFSQPSLVLNIDSNTNDVNFVANP